MYNQSMKCSGESGKGGYRGVPKPGQVTKRCSMKELCYRVGGEVKQEISSSKELMKAK